MIYIYTCKCGNQTEKNLLLSKFKKTCECDKCGERMGINIKAQQSNRRTTAGAWPMTSDAMGVHPAQAKEYADYLRMKGVPTEINADGNPILTSRNHRKRVCAATGQYDRNAGYGDQSRTTPLPEKTPRKRFNKGA